jgi:fatty-acyl-CoA synthase
MVQEATIDKSTVSTLVQALNSAPANRPFVTFWIDEDEQEIVTFGEFRCRARVCAAHLQRHGVVHGDRVVIIMPQGIAAMAAFAGAMMLGAVPAFLAYPNFKIEPAKYRSGLQGVTKNLGARAILIDEAFPDEMLSYVDHGESLLLRATDTGTEVFDQLSPAEPDHLAFIQHSAGTTGLQKGVALTHAAVLRHIENLHYALRIDHSDRIYSWLPLYHDMGLIACFMLPMVCHLPVVMQSPLDWVMHPDAMLEIISEHKCTLAWLPNFAFQFVARRTPASRRSRYDLSSMRAFINCSEPVRAASMNEFRDAFSIARLKPSALQSSYAMAENVFAVSQSEIAEEASPKRIWADAQAFRCEHRVIAVAEQTPGAICFVSSGHLLPGNEVRIQSESAEKLNEGEVGEIFLESDTLFNGYFNRPDLTAKALAKGWYRTGDLGFVLGPDLFVVGRKDDLLIVGGENLYPQDIEEAVSTHPAIHDGRCVALGLYNESLGTDDIVVVTELEADNSGVNPEDIERELSQLVVAATGVAVRRFILKPPKWIVKSTAGKPARAATREKLLREHPELGPKA